MVPYKLQLFGGTINVSEDFRLVFECEGGNPVVIWQPDSARKVALSLLFGPSGSGKSSLLAALYSYLRDPTRDGRADLKLQFAPEYGRGNGISVGYIPQHPPMVLHWRVREVIGKGCPFARQLLPDESLDATPSRSLREFSGGQCLKLYTASVVSRLGADGANGAFLILDEAFDGLGAGEAGRCLSVLTEQWTKQHQAPLHILLVTHLSRDELPVGRGAVRLRLKQIEQNRRQITTLIEGDCGHE